MRKFFTLRMIWSVLFFYLMSGTISVFAAVGDAGVTAILSPTNPVCRGNSTVSVIIHNFSGITISTAEVHWRVNAANQPTHNYAGNITTGNEDTVDIGNFNFTSGPYTIKAWTEDPNGSADSDNSNDTTTVVINVSSALTGAYTIAGTSPDYNTFNSAINALIVNGICGPVTFNIRPHTDTLQSVIPEINGADSINTITFQAENGDSSSVIFTFPSQDTLVNNHLISLDGADYIIFNKLTMQRTGIKANAHIIEFTNNATHNTVTHCRLLGATGTTQNSLAAMLYSSSISPSPTNDSMNTFTYNYMKNGSLGIYMNGVSSLDPEYNITIKFNQFIDQYSKGIQNTNQGNTTIEGNTFTTTSPYAGYAAVYLDRSLRPHHIIKNKILGTPGAGMYFVDCTAQSGVHGVIANNFIQSNDSAGISMVNCDYQDIVHNSILMTGSTGTFAALLMRGAGFGKIVKNNILANTGGGYSYVVSDSAVFGIQSSDHNNLFATGSFIGNYNGANQTTLNNWIAASGRDSASLNVNPSFVSPSDLHVASIAMDDQGVHINSVSDDIDGQIRSAVTPDIGADEYTSISRSVGVTAILNPIDSTCGSNPTSVIVVVRNTGGNPELNFPVTAKISGTITQTLNFTHSATLAPGQSDTVTFTPTINASATGVYTIKAYTGLAVDDVHANDTLTENIYLFAPPTSPGVTSTSICGPGTDTLFATSSDTLKWYSASSGGTLLATGPQYIPPAVASTTTYYVAAKSACEGPRVPVTLTVFPVPNVTLGNDTSINQGNSIILNAGGGFSSYLWSPGNLPTSTISVNTTGCYSVRVTNASGCIDRDTICVTVVVPNDVGVTTVIAPANHDCADDTIQVMVEVTNLGSNSATGIPVHVNITGAVTASFSDSITTSIAAGNHLVLNMGTINMSSGGNIVVTAYTSYSNDPDHSNDTIIDHDTLHIQPSIPSGISAAHCGPGIVVLISGATDSVYWYDAPTGGTLLFVGDNYVIPNLTTTTTFYSQNGQVCNNQNRRAVTGTVRPLPNLSLGNDTSAADSLVIDAGVWDIYEWSTGASTQTITVHNTGTYSVCVTDGNGCKNCDTIDVGIFVGIDPVHVNDNAFLYPNPARTIVTVEMAKPLTGKVSFIVTNIQGQIVLQQEAENISKQLLNVADFSSGVYHLQVSTSEGSSAYKLIIE